MTPYMAQRAKLTALKAKQAAAPVSKKKSKKKSSG